MIARDMAAIFERNETMDSGIWIIVVEAVLVLVMVGVIVWWTLPKRNKRDDEQQ